MKEVGDSEMKKKRSMLILIVLMVIGFASVSTTLVLNGVIGVGSDQDDFNVIFTKAKLNKVNRNEFIDKETKQTLTFETDKLSVVNEEAVLDYEVTNTSRLYDGEVTINCEVPENEYVEVEYAPKSMTIIAGETKVGSITAKLIKASTEDNSISIKCTLNATATERETLGEEYKGSPWKITEDNDNDGVLSKGDLITIGTESFYVYDIEGDKVKAIAQYNLYVGGQTIDDDYTVIPLENPTGLQSPLARGGLLDEEGNNAFPFIGVVPFISNETIDKLTEGQKPNDYNISDIKPYVDEYANKLSDLNANVDTVRLITKEELENAGCSEDGLSCKPGYKWDGGWKEDPTFVGTSMDFLYSTSYWTSSPSAGTARVVWRVGSFGLFGNDVVDDDVELGVRPVIEVSASLF